jgi:hypothetical protein
MQSFITGNKLQRTFGNLIILLVSGLFGHWFAVQQIHAVGVGALSTYPVAYLMLTVVKCMLTLFIFATLSQLLMSKLTGMFVSPLLVAMCYLPLVFAHQLVLMPFIFFAIVLFHLLTMASILYATHGQYSKKSMGVDVMVLLFFVAIHTVFTTRFSPLHWQDAILVADGYNSEEIPVLAPVFKSYVLAKHFSFTNIDHAQWAGIMNPPVSLNSPLLQLITFIGNLPSISYSVYHAVLMAVTFFMAILSSFSLYLFLRYAANLNFVFALFGGYLAFFGGAPILSDAFTADGGIFLSSYAVFPLALLLLTKAYEKSSLLNATWAGFALAAQFYISTPHPEGVIYSLLFYCTYAFGLFLFEKQTSVALRLKISLVAVVSFLVASLSTIGPILYDRLMGNMYVFAHVGDVHRIYFTPFTRYFILYAFSVPLSYYLLKRQQKLSPVYLSSLFLSTVLLMIILFARSTTLINLLIKLTHIGLHFWIVSRVGMYFCLSLFIIGMFTLQGLLDWVQPHTDARKGS